MTDSSRQPRKGTRKGLCVEPPSEHPRNPYAPEKRVTHSHSCPKSGRIVALAPLPQQYRPVLERRSSYDDLIDHLVRSTALQRGEAARVILDVLAYFDETTEDFVRRRHRELQSGGLVNAEIFERIAAELPHRAVAPPELSLRQLRRIVYG